MPLAGIATGNGTYTMPVERIDDALDQPGEVPQFAVLGRYSLGARFVEHVGLLAKQENWKSLQSEVHVHEMGISAKVGPDRKSVV